MGKKKVVPTDAHLHVVMDGLVMDALKDHAERERKPVSVVVRDLIVEKLRASDYKI